MIFENLKYPQKKVKIKGFSHFSFQKNKLPHGFFFQKSFFFFFNFSSLSKKNRLLKILENRIKTIFI